MWICKQSWEEMCTIGSRKPLCTVSSTPLGPRVQGVSNSVSPENKLLNTLYVCKLLQQRVGYHKGEKHMENEGLLLKFPVSQLLVQFWNRKSLEGKRMKCQAVSMSFLRHTRKFSHWCLFSETISDDWTKARHNLLGIMPEEMATFILSPLFRSLTHVPFNS